MNNWVMPPINGYNSNNSTTNFMNPSFNSFPQYKIIEVRGIEGAQCIKMAPNSATILIDAEAPIAYIARTDGAGYLQIKDYDLVPRDHAPVSNLSNLEQRISKIEEYINNVQQSNSNDAKQRRNKQQSQSDSTS